MKVTNSFLGFTLAELLAVIIIVSILAGLSVGYYKRSVEQSRFSEGLAAAGAVVEALNRTYFDERLEGIELPSGQVHSLSTLDVSAGAKHFVVSIAQDDNNEEVVRAYRGGTGGPYYIQMYPDYASGAKKDKIACVGRTADGLAFCQAMGYTVNCQSAGDLCTKS